MKTYFVTVANRAPFGSGYYSVTVNNRSEVENVLVNAGIKEWVAVHHQFETIKLNSQRRLIRNLYK